jgi:lipopolysaccharide/colanic/teichoic acid biosynthesis glycosyltransferase
MKIYRNFFKRIFDFLFSLLVLIVISPILLIVAIAIKIESPGPVIFKQTRLGRYGKPFTIYKFRSMCVGAEKKGSGQYSFKDDPRVTKVGRIIRALSIDELPQLINVFVGDMSLVGPRPEVRHYVNYWTPEQMHVLDVRPGITDPASIKFRNENELMEQAADPEDYYINVIMQDKIKLYLEYVENASFWYDIKLIFKTFLVIVKE